MLFFVFLKPQKNHSDLSLPLSFPAKASSNQRLSLSLSTRALSQTLASLLPARTQASPQTLSPSYLRSASPFLSRPAEPKAPPLFLAQLPHSSSAQKATKTCIAISLSLCEKLQPAISQRALRCAPASLSFSNLKPSFFFLAQQGFLTHWAALNSPQLSSLQKNPDQRLNPLFPLSRLHLPTKNLAAPSLPQIHKNSSLLSLCPQTPSFSQLLSLFSLSPKKPQLPLTLAQKETRTRKIPALSLGSPSLLLPPKQPRKQPKPPALSNQRKPSAHSPSPSCSLPLGFSHTKNQNRRHFSLLVNPRV